MIAEVSLRYRADITAGSLKVAESRVIADLLLKETSHDAWKAALYEENVLQTRTARTAERVSILIRKRLQTMDSGLWRLVRDGNFTVATHACLAAAVKHSALLADFLELVVKEQYRIFGDRLTYQMWDEFIDDCQNRDVDLPAWSESTYQQKLPIDLRPARSKVVTTSRFRIQMTALRLCQLDSKPVEFFYLLRRHFLVFESGSRFQDSIAA